MSQSQSQHIYVEVRTFRFDPEKGDVLPATTAPGVVPIDSKALEFRNLAQAAAVFEDAARVLKSAEETGKHELEERPKPGPAPKVGKK